MANQTCSRYYSKLGRCRNRYLYRKYIDQPNGQRNYRLNLDRRIIAYALFEARLPATLYFVHDSGMEAAHMRKRNKRLPCRKIVLKLPDLDHAKSAVLNSLSSPHSRRNYKFAMEQFITWYCSEPRLALNRTVVLRFRLYLESLGLAAGTVNQRLAAVRRLAYEAADSGLLSPELAAGIRRVKGAKQLGARMGNWLTQDQARLLLEKADGDDLRSVARSRNDFCARGLRIASGRALLR